MSKMGSFSVTGLEELQKQLDKIQGQAVDDFMEACTKELASRLLTKVIKRTPVGVYPSSTGKVGGTLRRGWTAQNGNGGLNESAAQYTLAVNRVGDTYVIEIVNPVEYASYVEFGHRTANHSGWVDGQFMLTISEDELRNIAPSVLQAKLKTFLGGAFM